MIKSSWGDILSIPKKNEAIAEKVMDVPTCEICEDPSDFAAARPTLDRCWNLEYATRPSLSQLLLSTSLLVLYF